MSAMSERRITPELIEKLEGEMLRLQQGACGVRHWFVNGLYVRELTVPAGTYAIGHEQRFEHFNVFLKGCVEMIMDDGSTRVLRAPMIFIGQPGRKIGYVHEDMVWINVFPAANRDVEALEAQYFKKSKTFSGHMKALSHDYPKLLNDLGVSEETVRAQSENEEDQIPFPNGAYKVKVGRSRIEGMGLIATGDIAAGEPIALARICGKRTPAGRYTNHSDTPNARMIPSGDKIVLVAIRHISGSVGGMDGEEITVNYRESVEAAMRTDQ